MNKHFNRLLIFIVLFFISFMIGCGNNKEIIKLEEELKDKNTEIETLKNQLNDQSNNLDEIINQNKISNEKIESLEILINELQYLLNDLNLKLLNNQNEIDKLLKNNLLKNEYIDFINKIISVGVNLDDYLSFKLTHNISENIELEELLDRIYYYYNKTLSIKYLGDVISSDDYTIFPVDGDLIEYVNIDVDKNLLNKCGDRRIAYSYSIIFFESNLDLNIYLDKVKKAAEQAGEDCPYTMIGYNFLIKFEFGFDEGCIMRDELKEIGDYIDYLIESQTFISTNDFIEKLNEINTKGYYTVSTNSTSPYGCTNFLVSIGNLKYIRIFYTQNENDIDYVRTYFELPSGVDLREYEESSVYFYGKIAIYFVRRGQLSDRIEDINGSNLYNVINERFVCYKDLIK